MNGKRMKKREEGLRFKYSRGRQLRIKDKNCMRREVEAEPQKNLLAIWAVPGWNGLPGDTAEPHCSCRGKADKAGPGEQSCRAGGRAGELESPPLFQQGSHSRHTAAPFPLPLPCSSCSCLSQRSLNTTGEAIFHYNACNDLLMNYSLCFRRDTISMCHWSLGGKNKDDSVETGWDLSG